MSTESPEPAYFDGLPKEEQDKIIETGREMVKLAYSHAVGLIIGPPPSHQGEINTATGCLLDLNGKTYLLTAEHVLRGFESRQAQDQSVRIQACDLLLDPAKRVVFRDEIVDVVMIELTAEERQLIPIPACSASHGWPPPQPQPGDYVLVSGFPATIRSQPRPGLVDMNALSAMLQVTASGQLHMISQWDRDNFVGFTGTGLPPHGVELGGMSGGPVLLVGGISYPLVGLITDFQSDWELMRYASLSSVVPC